MHNFVLGWKATLKFRIRLNKNLPLFHLEIEYKLTRLFKYLQNIDYRSHWSFYGSFFFVDLSFVFKKCTILNLRVSSLSN